MNRHIKIIQKEKLDEQCSDRSSDQFHSASSGSMGYYSDPYVVQQPLNNYADMRPQFMKDRLLEKRLQSMAPIFQPPKGTNVFMNHLRGY